METEWLDQLFRPKPPLQQRLDRLRPQSRADAYITVHARATYYPYYAKVFVPFKPWRQLQPGIQARLPVARKKQTAKQQSEEDLESSIRRSKKHVRNYIECNRFDLFCTFTFKEDRHDIGKCRRKMSNWLKTQSRRKGKFAYLIVPELHKDGALHFHALLKDYPGKVERAINAKTGKPLKRGGRQAYNLPSYTLGFTNAAMIMESQESYAKIAAYVRKYITKDMPLFPGKKRYWPSKGLRKPIIDDNPTWYEAYKPDKVYEGEYGTTYFYLNNFVIPPKYRVELFKVQTLPGILDEPS